MPELRYFSHSRCDTDESCRRHRYLSSEWGGTGLSPTNAGWDLVYGNLIHSHLDGLAKTGGIDYIAARMECYKAAVDAGIGMLIARDWSAMAEGHLRGFVKNVWPRWMKEYDIVEAEKMRSWDALTADPWYGADSSVQQVFRFRYRQDILLRNKFNGQLTYIDYKTTSSDDSKWVASWSKHPQLHSSAYAMAQNGINIDQMLVQGLYKGWKDKKTGGPTSIFCKGWVNRQFSMMPEYSYTYQRSKGWEAFSTADEFDDLSEWVANMPADILLKQFPCTGPIMPRMDIGKEWFAQQLIREVEVAEAASKLQSAQSQDEVDQILRRYFKQNLTKCQPSFGYECEMKNICWVPSVGADPLASGEFKRREQIFEDGVE